MMTYSKSIVAASIAALVVGGIVLALLGRGGAGNGTSTPQGLLGSPITPTDSAPGFALAPAASQARQETCKQCKFADCLKGIVDQKRAIAAGYDQLAGRIEQTSLREGQPVDEMNFATFRDNAARQAWYLENLRQLQGYYSQAQAMVEAVGPPQGCGLSNLEVETDSYEFCTTKPLLLSAAQRAMPCRELADLIDRHEAIHRNACEARRTTNSTWWHYSVAGSSTLAKDLPGRMLTPAGLAREEARAYRWEAAEVQKLHEEASKNCKLTFSGAAVSCVLRYPAGTVTMGQTIAGTACGAPAATTWMFSTESWMKPGGRSTDSFEGVCVEKNSAIERNQAAVYRQAPAGTGGWLCVYDKDDPDRITIRNFPMKMCSPNTEQVVTVDLLRSTESCDVSTQPSTPSSPQPEPPPTRSVS